MPHKELNYVQAPIIYPVRRYMDLPETFITTDTRIELHTDTPETRMYFTSDGSEPDPFHRTSLAKQKTHKYKGPFSLLAGTRTVRAIAITRNMRFQSHISTRTFIVRDSFDFGVDLSRPNDDGSVVSLVSTTDSELTVVSQDVDLDEERLLRALQRQNELDMHDTGHRSLRDGWIERERSREMLERARSPGILRDTERTLSDRMGLGSSRVHFASYDSYQHAGFPSTRSLRSHRSARSYDPSLETSRLLQGYNGVDVREGREIRPVRNNFIDEAELDRELQALEEKEERLRNSGTYSPITDNDISARDKNGRVVSPPTVSTYRNEEKKDNEKVIKKDSDADDDATYIISDDGSKKKHNQNFKGKDSDKVKQPKSKSSSKPSTKDKLDKKKKKSKSESSSSSSSSSESESNVSSVPSSAAAMPKKKKSKSKSKSPAQNGFDYWGMSPEEVIQSVRMSSQPQQQYYPQPVYTHPMMGPQMYPNGPQMNGPPMHPQMMAPQMNPQMGPQMYPYVNGNAPSAGGSPQHSRRKMKPPESVVSESTSVGSESTVSHKEKQEKSKRPSSSKPAVIASRTAKQKSSTRNSRTASLQDFLGPDASQDDAASEISAMVMTTNHSAPISAKAQSENQFFDGLAKKAKKFFKGWFPPDDKASDNPDSAQTVGKSGSADEKVLTYDQILSKCQKNRKLWEDPNFAASDESIYVGSSDKSKIEWKRPQEICKNPEFFVGGASRLDVKQGVLGNCWLLAAVSSLASDEQLFNRVVPSGQSFSNNYFGVFRFRFWQYGRWVEVCVDDRLPTKRGKLIYMHAESENEFWSALIEKAYAKLCGCYEALTGGLASEAMTDFTGGITERFNFREEVPDNMFQILTKAKQRHSLMGCSIDAKPDEMEAKLDNGLIMGHAYSITDVNIVTTKKGPVQLIRVRNPWGDSAEWTGAWGDSSEEWRSISEEDRKKIGLSFEHDGEFWMSFKDFVTHFQRVEVCNIVLQDSGSSEDKKWQATLLEGAWIKKVNAGGCRNHPGSYSKNPQYRVTVTDPDEDDEEEICTVIVGLMQKDRRKLRRQGKANLTIGYDIYDVGQHNKDTLDEQFFKHNGPVASAPQYINMREVCGRHRLPPGHYCIIPTTFEPNEEGAFIIRVYTEKDSDVREVDSPTTMVAANEDMSGTHLAPITAALESDLAEQAEEQFESRCGEDKQVDAYELQAILNETFSQGFDFGEFDINLCRSMVALRDTDQSGMLGFEEFKILWHELRTWKTVYKKYDTDNSGHFNSFELREALKSVGYQTSNATFKAIVMRYSDRQGYIRFDDFVACIIKLKALFDIFNQNMKKDTASFELDQFIQLTMYS